MQEPPDLGHKSARGVVLIERPYISTRRIGDATLTGIDEAVVEVPLTTVFPAPEVAWLRAHGEADAADLLTTYQAVVVIRLGDAPIAIDPAFNREIVPGVATLHAPDESSDHSIVRVASGGQTFYALGDLFHHACEVDHMDWPRPGSIAMRCGATHD